MLIELLRRAAGEVPRQPAIISRTSTLSYADALARSIALAHGLRARGIERVAIAVEDPADVLSLLAAASAADCEACVYPRDLEPGGIDALATRFDHRTVVVDRPVTLGAAETLSCDQLAVSGEGEPAESGHAPVLILTTGTTGAPKGARHEWSRLLQAIRHPDERPGSRWLLAYNLNQFAGLQVLLHVLASIGTLVGAPSRQPRGVIETIREYRVTHVSATPTLWRLVVGSLDPDEAARLPLEQITLGGEAAPGPLLQRLAELFPAARVTHIYAGTEFGTVMSASDGRPGFPLSVLERGRDAAAQMRIVEGELQMRSRGGMLGYHDSEDDEREWRPTGDLVEVRDDRIHFVGRTSDIINVGGAKVHPLPIEEIVSGVEGVALAAAYGRPNPVTGQIVALDVVTSPGADQEAVERKIREACETLPRPGRPRRIRFVSELETHGHKLRRPAPGSVQ